MAKAIAIIPILETNYTEKDGMNMHVDMQTIPIVLCRDCINFKADKGKIGGICQRHNLKINAKWFCADGEEK